jgi:Ca2+-binding EF-hand superfamily protein
MCEEEEKQKLPTHLEYILNNTAIIPIIFLLFVFRPREGYIQRIELFIFSIESGNPPEISLIVELLPLIIIIPLIFYRERVSASMNNFLRSQIAKEVIEEFDEDGDEKLTKEESQGFFSTIMEDLDEEEKKDFDSDALFDKYDSDRDGKLDGDEISSLILELFAQKLAYPNQESSSVSETVKSAPSEDEIQKLDRLYKEGYLSEERYERLKQDLNR